MYYNGDRLWRWFSRYTYKVKTPLLCLHIRVSTAGVFLWDIRRQIKGKYAFFCLKCKGDSMINARIYDGDIVFVRKQSMVNNGEVAVVLIEDEATLKRVFYYPDKAKLVLQAENPSFEPLVYIGEEIEQIRILGKAVAFQSDVK